MTFFAGYMGLLTAFAADESSPTTEFSGPGYARQAVRFAKTRHGISKLATPYTFGDLAVGAAIGRALYAGPTFTVPTLILLFGNGPRGFPSNAPTDAGDVGSITLFVSGMAAYADGAAFMGNLNNGAGGFQAIGTVYDSTDELMAPWSNTPGPGHVIQRAIATGALYLVIGSGSVIGGQLLPVSDLPDPQGGVGP